MSVLEIRDLHASIAGKEILKGVNLKIKSGELHSLMGPNGSGKSTLSYVIMGHPKYAVTKGDILLDGESILGLLPDERARKGLFLAFQQPVEIPGVSVTRFLYTAFGVMQEQDLAGNPSAAKGAKMAFPQLLKTSLESVGLYEDFAKRSLNAGFSGGERKRAEVLQMAILKPKIAFLDEIDSGLDIDALKTVSRAIKAQARGTGMLVITHYQRILKHLQPDFVHIMVDGRIVTSGGHDLAVTLEEKGYAGLLRPLGIEYSEKTEA